MRHALRRPSVVVAALLAVCWALPLRAQVWAPAAPQNQAVPPPPPGFSGMVKIDAATFLVVHDVKSPSDEPRLSALSVGFGRTPHVTPVHLTTNIAGEAPNDLESICAVPGKGNQFLLCESGYYEGKFGRVLQIELARNGGDLDATVFRSYPLPKLPTDVEGIACLKRKDKSPLVLLGVRGGHGQRGEVVVCELDEEKGTLTPLKGAAGHKPLVSPAEGWAHPEHRRDCGELYVDAQHRIWVSATEDPGDPGPFRSVIYQAGTVDPDAEDPVTLTPNPKAQWTLDGIKVEAIGPGVIEGSALSVASDDEDYGGVWRPLALPKHEKEKGEK